VNPNLNTTIQEVSEKNWCRWWK